MRKTKRQRGVGILFVFLWIGWHVSAQYSMGVSGLLNVPSGDMQTDGLFSGGGNYLPREMIPDRFGGNTGNYFLSLTFLPFIEMTYRCTLEHHRDFQRKNHWQQDRSVSLKLRVLKERRYIPSIAFGSNDAFTTHTLDPVSSVKDNRFFASLYGAATKQILFGGHTLSFTVGSYIPIRQQTHNKGFFGGIRYTPCFFRSLDIIAEYGNEKVNAGFGIGLFGHLRCHVFTYGMKAVSGGIRYEFILY